MKFRFKFNYQMLLFMSLLSAINVSISMVMPEAHQAAEQERTCIICDEGKDVSQFHTNTICHHNDTCKECVRQIIEIAIRDDNSDSFNCSNCRTLLDIADARAIGINQQNLFRLQRILDIRNNPEYIRQTFKRCPNCGILIEKGEGCLQMRCRDGYGRGCRHRFWWCCLLSNIPNNQPFGHRQYQGQGDPYASCEGRARPRGVEVQFEPINNDIGIVIPIRNVIAGGLVALVGYVLYRVYSIWSENRREQQDLVNNYNIIDDEDINSDDEE